MSNFAFIHSTDGPWLHICISDLSSITNLTWRLRLERGPTLDVRFLRGNKMANWEMLFCEFAAALQFPYYFGENLNAFDECITDLEWLNAKEYFLVILKADLILSGCSDEDFRAVIDHLNIAASKWAKPVQARQAWCREARPFHIVFHTEKINLERFLARLSKSGINITEMIYVGA